MNFLKPLRRYMERLYRANAYYAALQTESERLAFLDALINAMSHTEMLEHLEWAIKEALDA